MGREPLGLPPSGKVHTCHPYPPRAFPRPETLASFPNKKFRQPCSVSEAWEAVAGAIKTFLEHVLAVLGQSHPTHPPP
eukprot:1159437-Pelagomonas_calceolata.AAC.1